MGGAMKGQQSWDMGGRNAAPRYAMLRLIDEDFEKFWPDISNMMDQVPHTWERWPKETIFSGLMGGQIQVWTIGPPPKAVFVFMTMVVTYPSGLKCLEVCWGAGSYNEEMNQLMLQTLTDFALSQGCSKIEILGRAGWEKKFQSLGFRRTTTVLSLDIAKERSN